MENKEKLYKPIDPANFNVFDCKNINTLRSACLQFPYFEGALFRYLKELYIYNVELFDKALQQVSIFIGDRKALFYYIFEEEFKTFFEQTGNTAIQSNKTDILLNAFFEDKGETNSNDDKEFEYNLSHSSLASIDYFTYLNSVSPSSRNSESEPDIVFKKQEIIDRFMNSEQDMRLSIRAIDENPDSEKNIPENVKNNNESALDEDLFFTETLAKIYIKQKKHEKAYKIIKHLSLKYPKKNIYFADQLSFLEKLIINSKSKDKK